ncbi:hypothetical protein [Flavobacterium sp.]|uniref:hypothetical protein n=1 Tax=Flavobacterium sp. TaxID=239 RepID=UPI00286C5E2F|nr:hypothetical protein [Flavobacterium sp.]
MKTFINKIRLSVIALCFIFLNSCSSDESVSSKIQSDVTAGAILRTIKVNQATFNFFDPSAKWSVTLEHQDAANGSLLAEVKLYARQTTGGVNKTEKFLKSYAASTFVAGPNDGYLRGDVTASLAEVLTALGLTTGQYTASDKMRIRLELILTDGRKFTLSDGSPTITGGSYFRSPYQYSVQFFCPLANASSFSGNYKVVTDAWADYNPGEIVPVQYNAADGLYTFRIRSTNNIYINNPGTSWMAVTINPATGGATVLSNEPFDYGVPPTTVRGTGSVGTCTGDINLSLDFSGGYNATKQGFTLVKAGS